MCSNLGSRVNHHHNCQPTEARSCCPIAKAGLLKGGEFTIRAQLVSVIANHYPHLRRRASLLLPLAFCVLCLFSFCLEAVLFRLRPTGHPKKSYTRQLAQMQKPSGAAVPWQSSFDHWLFSSTSMRPMCENLSKRGWSSVPLPASVQQPSLGPKAPSLRQFSVVRPWLPGRDPAASPLPALQARHNCNHQDSNY